MLINTITPSVSVYYGESAQDLALMPTTTTIGQGDYPRVLASLGSYAIILESNGLKKYKLRSTGWVEVVESGGGGSVIVDNTLSTTSTNPVQNKVITNEINGKQRQMQFDVMPDAGDYNGVVVIYTGNDTLDYIKGNSYISDGTNWASTSSSDAQPLTEAQLNALLNILD